MERASNPLQPVQGFDKVAPGHHSLDGQGRTGTDKGGQGRTGAIWAKSDNPFSRFKLALLLLNFKNSTATVETSSCQ